MELNKIIRIASSAYPDDLIASCWDFEKSRPTRYPKVIGDGLAAFIVQELYETYDAVADDYHQLRQAARAMRIARDQVSAVVEKLDESAIDILEARV